MNIFKMSQNLKNFKKHYRDPLFKNSYFLMGNIFLFSGVGFLFWIIAARFYSPAEIGIGSTIISTTSFFSIFSLIGLDISLIRYLPDEKDKVSMINSSFLLTAIISLLISIIFILGTSIWSPALDILKKNYILGLFFIFFTIFASLSTLQISIFIAFRHSKYSFYQSIINISKVILLPLLTFFGVFGLYSAFGITYILTFIWGNKYIQKIHSSYQFTPKIDIIIVKKMFFYSLGNYLANILIYFPNYILPLMLLNILGSTITGYFYIAWTLSSVLLTISGSVSRSLLAEGSLTPENNQKNILKSLKFTFVILIPLIILIILFGKYFLLLFGKDYAFYSNSIHFSSNISSKPS